MSDMIKQFDRWLNNITMYALVQYGLLAVITIATGLGFAGILPYSGWSILISVTILASVCRGLNLLLAKLWRATPSVESATITGFILTLVLAPPRAPRDYLTLALVAAVAMMSKYVLAVRRQHVFNPAAIALVIIGLAGSTSAIWWVATPVLLPATAILGFLVARKLQRLSFVATCISAALVVMSALAIQQGSWTPSVITTAFLSWPLVFWATIMVTEPATIPTTKRLRYAYAVIAGGLFAAQLQVGPIATTPEVALVIANLFAFGVSRRRRVRLTLVETRELAASTQEFVFKADRSMPFKAGQYLEWALPHRRPDLRGSRRYFTIAASPTEEHLRLGIKLGPGRISSFKTALAAMTPGQWLTAAHAAGDFTLPEDPTIPLVWIAGGIGVTPFRSMAKFLNDTKDKRKVDLLYLAGLPEAFAYRDVFDEAAKKLGIRVHYILTDPTKDPKWAGPTGPLTPEMLAKLVPDWSSRRYYVSGPSGLVASLRGKLSASGIKASDIKVDDFPGF